MYQPASRVLTVLELLQSRSVITGPELAAGLEVDIRTVRRYIVTLQDIGIPIEAMPGRHGGYRLRPGFKLPPLMFNNEEALALALALLAARRLGVDEISPTIEGVMAKIERALPVELRQRVQAVYEALVFESDASSSNSKVKSVVVQTISSAVLYSHCVRILYCNSTRDETERLVDPYGITYYDGRWYMAGYCHLRSALRVFRLDRVTCVSIEPQTFTRPADFHRITYRI